MVVDDAGASPLFSADEAHEDGQRVVDLASELDLAGRAAVSSVIRGSGAAGTSAQLDLSDLTFASCTGVGGIVDGRNVVFDNGGTVTAGHAHGVVALVLELTGMTALLAHVIV